MRYKCEPEREDVQNVLLSISTPRRLRWGPSCHILESRYIRVLILRNNYTAHRFHATFRRFVPFCSYSTLDPNFARRVCLCNTQRATRNSLTSIRYGIHKYPAASFDPRHYSSSKVLKNSLGKIRRGSRLLWWQRASSLGWRC